MPARQAPDDHEYLLGTDAEELRRLAEQHEAWRPFTEALWTRAGFATGQRLLDIGAGPGWTSFDLAARVGPTGRVLASDVSARFADFVRSESARRGLAQVEMRLGAIEALEVPDESLDGAFARWLFCWLPDPGAALARVAPALRRGAALAVQDYVDWGATKLLPRSERHDEVVLACLRSFDLGGGTIDIGERLPRLAVEHGLRVEHAAPVGRLAAPGSSDWRWIGGFFGSYLPRLVERGQLTAAAARDFFADWERRAADGNTRLLTPTVIDLVLRKP